MSAPRSARFQCKTDLARGKSTEPSLQYLPIVPVQLPPHPNESKWLQHLQEACPLTKTENGHTHLPGLRQCQLRNFPFGPSRAAFGIQQTSKWHTVVPFHQLHRGFELWGVVGDLVLAVHGPDVGSGFLLHSTARFAVETLRKCWRQEATRKQGRRSHWWVRAMGARVLLSGRFSEAKLGCGWSFARLLPIGVWWSCRSAGIGTWVLLVLIMSTRGLLMTGVLSPADRLSGLGSTWTVTPSWPVWSP